MDTIRDAAKFLDNHMPGWYNKIDVSIFDMKQHKRCILGQLYGNYDKVYHRDEFLPYSKSFGWDSKLEDWLTEIKNRFLSNPETEKTMAASFDVIKTYNGYLQKIHSEDGITFKIVKDVKDASRYGRDYGLYLSLHNLHKDLKIVEYYIDGAPKHIQVSEETKVVFVEKEVK